MNQIRHQFNLVYLQLNCLKSMSHQIVPYQDNSKLNSKNTNHIHYVNQMKPKKSEKMSLLILSLCKSRLICHHISPVMVASKLKIFITIFSCKCRSKKCRKPYQETVRRGLNIISSTFSELGFRVL